MSPLRGKRTVWGGRARVRTALYLGAMVASRFNPVIRDFYQRLLAAGKPQELALTAGTRKLLIILNSMLKHGSPWNHPVAPSPSPIPPDFQDSCWSARSGNAFANPMSTDAPIDRRVHRTIIPEIDVPSHHTETAQQRGQEQQGNPRVRSIGIRPPHYSSGGPRSIQERRSRSARRRDSSARRRAPSLIASSQGETQLSTPPPELSTEDVGGGADDGWI